MSSHLCFDGSYVQLSGVNQSQVLLEREVVMVEETKSILSTEEDNNSSRMPLNNVLGTSGVKFNSHQQHLISSQ